MYLKIDYESVKIKYHVLIINILLLVIMHVYEYA